MTSSVAGGYQHGGDHYRRKGIQPIDVIFDWGLNFAEGSIVKYVARWRDKGGVDDLQKAKHYLEMLIRWEEQAQP